MAKHEDAVPSAPARRASRRELLKGLSAAAVGASPAAAAAAAAEPEQSAPDPTRTEYRETDHIRRFYELARG